LTQKGIFDDELTRGFEEAVAEFMKAFVPSETVEEADDIEGEVPEGGEKDEEASADEDATADDERDESTDT